MELQRSLRDQVLGESEPLVEQLAVWVQRTSFDSMPSQLLGLFLSRKYPWLIEPGKSLESLQLKICGARHRRCCFKVNVNITSLPQLLVLFHLFVSLP